VNTFQTRIVHADPTKRIDSYLVTEPYLNIDFEPGLYKVAFYSVEGSKIRHALDITNSTFHVIEDAATIQTDKQMYTKFDALSLSLSTKRNVPLNGPFTVAVVAQTSAESISTVVKYYNLTKDVNVIATQTLNGTIVIDWHDTGSFKLEVRTSTGMGTMNVWTTSVIFLIF
jgi:hypothetical protein